MTNFVKLAGATLASILFAATALPADAATYEIKISGLVIGGRLNADVFGLTAGSDIAGLPYEMAFLFSDDLPAHLDLGPNTSTVTSGSYFYGAAEPLVVSASFTLNGQTFSVAGNWSGFIQKDYANGSVDQVSLQAIDLIGEQQNIINETFLALPGAFASSDPREIVTDIPAYADNGISGGGYVSSSIGDSIFFEIYTDESLSVSKVERAVPEPASWALMILGFGTVGLALRRRPRQARIAFA